MRKTASSKLSPEEELLLTMEEPPEILAEGALAHFGPELDAPRIASFLDACVQGGLATKGKQEGSWKQGKTTLQPERFLQDFAATDDEVRSFRKFMNKVASAPALCRAKVASKLDKPAAKKAVGGTPKLTHAPVLVGSFMISALYYAEKQRLVNLAVDLKTGKHWPEVEASLAELPGCESEPMKPGGNAKALATGIEALRVLATEQAEGLFKLVKDEVARARADRRATMEGYFEGLEEEYQKEERRMYYHLYYFDQQEKLAAKRKEDMEERQKLVAVQEQYYRIEIEMTLDSLAVLELPVWTNGEKKLCGLTGRRL